MQMARGVGSNRRFRRWNNTIAALVEAVLYRRISRLDPSLFVWAGADRDMTGATVNAPWVIPAAVGLLDQALAGASSRLDSEVSIGTRVPARRHANLSLARWRSGSGRRELA
jgi:hypothetical protein